LVFPPLSPRRRRDGEDIGDAPRSAWRRRGGRVDRREALLCDRGAAREGSVEEGDSRGSGSRHQDGAEVVDAILAAAGAVAAGPAAGSLAGVPESTSAGGGFQCGGA